MTFTLCAENDAGNGGDLRAIEQCFGSFATVLVDTTHVGESVERAGGRLAVQSDLVQAFEQQVATHAILVTNRCELRRSDAQRSDAGPLCWRRDAVG